MSKIARHKTAIRRPSFSLPIKCLLRDGLIDSSTTVFDYGCGHGQDIQLLQDMGIECDGYDPKYRAEVDKKTADVVNLGYVINVVEDPRERAKALKSAWELAKKVFVVAAQIEFAAHNKDLPAFGDGVLTSRGTFQKYYTQAELREYLERQLDADAIPAAPGIFYVFRDEGTKQQHVASRYRRRTIPNKRNSEVQFEQNQNVLQPLMDRIVDLGRLPAEDELEQSQEIIERLGSLKKAYALIRRITGEDQWEYVGQQRTEDLLVYLALSRFRKRPKLSELPLSIQRDIKAFFGTYRIACGRADVLLFRAGDPEAIDQACQRSSVGRLQGNGLYVHRSALDYLEPLLRIYEGCARTIIGDVDEANVIKLHRYSGKVTYLSYFNFDKVAHPSLRSRMKVSMRTASIEQFDYSKTANPQLLFKKEELVERNYAGFQKFATLTKQEVKQGVLRGVLGHMSQSELNVRLRELRLRISGHRIRKL